MKMSRSKMLRIGMAVFLFAVALAFFIGTFSIKQAKTQAQQSISARFFPRAIIAIFAVASIICVISEFKKDDDKGEDERKLKSMIMSVIVMGACVLLLDILGFFIIGFLFLLLEISIMKEKKPDLTTLIVSLGCTLVFSLLFRYGFNIGIPLMPFGLL